MSLRATGSRWPARGFRGGLGRFSKKPHSAHSHRFHNINHNGAKHLKHQAEVQFGFGFPGRYGCSSISRLATADTNRCHCSMSMTAFSSINSKIRLDTDIRNLNQGSIRSFRTSSVTEHSYVGGSATTGSEESDVPKTQSGKTSRRSRIKSFLRRLLRRDRSKTNVNSNTSRNLSVNSTADVGVGDSTNNNSTSAASTIAGTSAATGDRQVSGRSRLLQLLLLGLLTTYAVYGGSSGDWTLLGPRRASYFWWKVKPLAWKYFYHVM
jgi:hypothetical protein